MKKNYTLILLLCTFLVLLAGCTPKNEPEMEKTILQEMQEYKTENIGDSTAVSSMLNYLPSLDERFVQKMFALQTENEPFGLIIYYEPLPDYEGVELIKTQEMETYAGYLFECIDNLGYVEFAYRTTVSDNTLIPEDYSTVTTITR